MRAALRMSSNRAAVQMLNTIGIPAAVSYAQKLNVGTPPSVPSLALGAGEVTLLSLTAAYGAFANEGTLRTPVLIRRVEDSGGRILYQDPGRSQRAVNEATAFLMSSMLADVINSGTAYKAPGVWVGFDQPKTIVRNGYAAELAVPIWSGFMKTATKDDKPDWFAKPANVVSVNVCRVSGKLPNYGCASVPATDEFGYLVTRSQVYTDYFVKGTQPTTVCPLHPGGMLLDAATLPVPASVPTTGVPAPGGPPPGVPTTGVPPPVPPVSGGTVEPPPQKKKGFWRRVFGGGGGGGGGGD